jgi:hypothetical protein
MGVTKIHSRPHVPERSPLFGKSFPKAKIQARLSGTLWLPGRCPDPNVVPSHIGANSQTPILSSYDA